MNPIPPLVHDLMWQIAEEGDLAAIREFESRYPDYVPELEKRIALVRQMRLARPNSPPPRFAPRIATARNPWPRSAWAAVGFLAASLAIATVLVVTRPAPSPVGRTTVGQTAGGGTSQPTAIPWGPREVPVQPDAGTGTQQPGQTSPPIVPASPFDKMVELDSGGVMLSQAIQSVASQASLRLSIAPLFEDKEIEAHYSGLTAKQVLDDLGQNFGFTLVIQQGNEALIVPALDPSRPPTNLPNESYSLPAEGG
ncbi:MAG: hypothetical protein AB7F50_09640 [Fimbriimonadaceae bacterium]